MPTFGWTSPRTKFVRVTYVITRGDSIGGAQVHVLHLATESAALATDEIAVVTGAASADLSDSKPPVSKCAFARACSAKSARSAI